MVLGRLFDWLGRVLGSRVGLVLVWALFVVLLVSFVLPLVVVLVVLVGLLTVSLVWGQGGGRVRNLGKLTDRIWEVREETQRILASKGLSLNPDPVADLYQVLVWLVSSTISLADKTKMFAVLKKTHRVLLKVAQQNVLEHEELVALTWVLGELDEIYVAVDQALVGC